jgi:dolichol-phosphate mannosyltransferase
VITSDVEIVFVDDRSGDGAWPVLRELAALDPAVRAIRLSRNFGQHAAITAGLTKASATWVVVMDCDLEDRPEEIPRLFQKAMEGHDLVLSRRRTAQTSMPRQLMARLYFRLRRAIMRLDVAPDYCTLSILARNVVNAFTAVKDRDRQYMLILHWLNFDRAVIEVERGERPSGKSAYTWRSLTRLAVDGFFFETTVLLTWTVYLGFFVALAGFGLAVFYAVSYFFLQPLSGFTSLAVLTLLIGGFVIISTGVTGLYVGRIFEQMKGRPLFIISDAAAREAGSTPARERVS